MALNKLMHPRNPYKNKKPDFRELAIKYAKFREHANTDLKGKVHLDFKKPECLRALSWALLKDDFGLDVLMPPDRLIPTIPLRLNYILWLEDLLAPTTPAQQVTAIDIGCGASCVYALLGAVKNKWHFVVSEADPTSVAYARKNVADNNLQERVKVVPVEPDSGLLDLVDSVATSSTPTGDNSSLTSLTDKNGSNSQAEKNTSPSNNSRKSLPSHFDFCMCNPPFFASNLEAWGMTSSRSDERPEPMSANSGSDVECIVIGGEVQFVKKMIRDSLTLKRKIRIYTTMLGKKSSLGILKEYLRQSEVTNFGSMEFCQGRTMRWALGWSFDDTVTFPKPPSKTVEKSKPKPPMTFVLPKTVNDVKEGWKIFSGLLNELEIAIKKESETVVSIRAKITAQQNTWSHQRRKRRQRKNPTNDQTSSQTTSQTTSQTCTKSDVENTCSEMSVEVKNVSDCDASGKRTDGGDKEEEIEMKSNKGQNIDCSSGDLKGNAKEREEKGEVEMSRGITDRKRKIGDNDTDIIGVKRVKVGFGKGLENKDKTLKDDDRQKVGGDLGEVGGKDGQMERGEDRQKEIMDRQQETVDGEKEVVQKEEQSALNEGNGNCGYEKGSQKLLITKAPEHSAEQSADATTPAVLVCEAVMKKVEEDIMVELQFVAGESREVMHQVLQYVKNKWK